MLPVMNSASTSPKVDNSDATMRGPVQEIVPALQSGSLFGGADGVLVVDANALLKAEAERDFLGGRLAALQIEQRQLHALPGSCSTCFNQYHCTYGCPGVCPMDYPCD